MSRRGTELAAMFRSAIEQAELARRRAEEERLRRIEAARQAREELLDDLEAFGQAVGFLGVQRHEDSLTLRFQERYIAFEPMGEADRVRVRFEGADEEEHRLYRETELGDRWVWTRRRRHREDRLPLFDQGLEELMVQALGLPRPGEATVVDASELPADFEELPDQGEALPTEEVDAPESNSSRRL